MKGDEEDITAVEEYYGPATRWPPRSWFSLAAGPTRLSLGLRDSAQYNCGCSRRRVEFRGLFENTG